METTQEQTNQEIVKAIIEGENCVVVNFDISGNVEAMQSDKFNLGFLGRQQVRRASEIAFNEATQLWDIHLCGRCPGGATCLQRAVDEAKGIDGYDLARKIEVKWLNAARAAGVSPASGFGRTLLTKARESLETRPTARLYADD